MLCDVPSKPRQTLQVDGIWMKFTLAHQGIQVSTYLSYNAWISREQLGDYGYFSDSGHFHHQGNLFTDVKHLIPEVDTIPRQQEMRPGLDSNTEVVDNYCLSLPSNHTFHSLLASLSPRFTNKYLVTRVVQCRRGEYCVGILGLVSDGRLVWGPNVGTTMTFCTIRKPFVWHLDVTPPASIHRLGGHSGKSNSNSQRSGQFREVRQWS